MRFLLFLFSQFFGAGKFYTANANARREHPQFSLNFGEPPDSAD
jgi:hypothetical protein